MRTPALPTTAPPEAGIPALSRAGYPALRARAVSAVIVVCAGIAAAASSPAALHAQQIRGRVVDEQSRQPVAGAVVTLLAADSSVVSRAEAGDDGFFTLEAKPGTYTIDVSSVGYATVSRSLVVRGEDMTVPAFTLSQQTIELEGVGVEAEAGTSIERGVVGFARARHVVAGERLATLERQGIRFPSAMRDLGAGLRVREWIDRNGFEHICIESSRRLPSFSNPSGEGACDWPALVIDGVLVEPGVTTVRGLDLHMYESIEYFTPVEAGTRYGLRGSAAGALVLWTRGRGPHVSDARNGGA